MAKRKAIKIGIVGLGRAGWGMHCKELEGRESKFEIVAGCDLLKPFRDRFQEKYPDAKVYKNYEDMLANEDIEMISVASRTPEHVEHAIMAMKAGKIVFQEKPIAVDFKEAQKLAKAKERYDAEIYMRHNRRFESMFQHIKEIIASGKLGEVYEVKLRRNNYSRRDDWQTIIECGGGQLLNWGPHIVDHALRFLDCPVAEMWSDLNKIAAAGDAEDHLKIVLKGENGRIIDMEISGGSAISEPEYVVSGTKGGLSASGKEIKLKYLSPKKELKRRIAKKKTLLDGGFGTPDDLKWIEKTIEVKPRKKMDTDSIWDYLYASIRNGKEFPVTLEEALEVMKVISETRKGTLFNTYNEKRAKNKK